MTNNPTQEHQGVQDRLKQIVADACIKAIDAVVKPGDYPLDTGILDEALAAINQLLQHKHKIVTHAVDMGDWTKVEKYCEECGLDANDIKRGLVRPT